jgi:hypothetical protein
LRYYPARYRSRFRTSSAVRFTDGGFILARASSNKSLGYCRPSVRCADWEGLAVKFYSEDNGEELMKNNYQVVPQIATKKPEKAEASDAEFRRGLKNISEWRKKRLAQLRAKDSR